MKRRCVTAAYSRSFTQVLPVNPVNHIDRFTPQERRQQHPKKNRDSFAAIFEALRKPQNPGNPSGFDAFA